MKKIMAGIDLHSNNAMIGLIDEDGRRLAHQKLDCQLPKILDFLDPYNSHFGDKFGRKKS